MKHENTILVGDVREQLAKLPDGCVQAVVTSPPYWRLRDYGTAKWKGGKKACRHRLTPRHQKQGRNSCRKDRSNVDAQRNGTFEEVCGKCGARRADKQIGLEKTAEEYCEKLVAVFREIRRVLRPDGTLWLNMGDSYSTAGTRHGNANGSVRRPQTSDPHRSGYRPSTAGLKSKNLIGMPWRVAFALQADGWYLRSDIIWSKPNPMPESVTDRPSKSHEYVFLFSKSAKYFCNMVAIREPDKGLDHKHRNVLTDQPSLSPPGQPLNRGIRTATGRNGLGRNCRTVWEIATQPYPDAHFATFPEKLVQRCILPGSKEGDTVLDPFMGSGTTALVALKAARKYVGIELNPEYAKLATKRIKKEQSQMRLL